MLEYKCRCFLVNKAKVMQCNIRDITARKKIAQELLKKIEGLEIYSKMATGRELKMIELKKEIDALLRRLGEKTRYSDDQ